MAAKKAKKSSFDGVKIKKKTEVIEPVIEEEHHNEVLDEPIIIEENLIETVEEMEKREGKKVGLAKSEVKTIGKVGDSVVKQPKGNIRFEAQVAPVPMFKIPLEIRRYLVNKGFSTDVWRKDKEWLERHGADMEMIKKLKDFLTGEL